MPGPSYQQFQGYPNPVGNYFAGQDAGRARAVEDFNTKQTLETQNALVQQSGAQSYPQLQAQQMQAKQMLDMYQPALQNAIENENYGMRDAIVGALQKIGNPMLGRFAEIAATAKKLDKGAYGYDVTFPDTEDGKAQRQAAWSKDAFLQSAYPNVEQIQLGVPYRVTTMGMLGTPGSHTNKFEAVSRTAAKQQTQRVDVKDAAQLDDLEAQYADNSDAMAAIDQARQLLPNSSGGVMVELPSSTKIGARAIKVPYQKPQQDTVSTMEGLQAAVADAPPAIAKKILAEAVPAIKKGNIITLARDAKGALTGSIISEKRPPAAGGAGGTGGAFPVMKYNEPGKYYGNLFKKDSGEAEFATLVSRFLSASVGGRNAFQAVGLSAGKQNDAKREEFLARVSDYMAQRGITQEDITTAAGAVSAVKQLQKQQSMLEINASVAEKGFSMLTDLRKKGQISTNAIPMLNHAENILRTWTGDAPPGAAQGVLTEVLVDYAKVVSGQTSTAGVTMYAAKLAKELMELKDNPAQFQLKIGQYGKLMRARLTSGRTVIKGLGKMTDVGNKGQGSGPGLDAYISTMVQKYPQYKSKTRAEWQTAYDQKFSGGQ